MLTFRTAAFFGLCAIVLCASCMHRVSKDLFPASSADIDFVSVKQQSKASDTNLKRSPQHEHYFELRLEISENEFVETVSHVLSNSRFKHIHVDPESNRVIGERGMTANEWNSICAVYYAQDEDMYNVYTLFKMTQDVTGGFDVNKAAKVGSQLKKALLEKR